MATKAILSCALAFAVMVARAAYVDEMRAEISQGEVNVRDFGAVGDGIHDDTAAITAAARAVEEQDVQQRAPQCEEDGPHGRLVFPAGTYRLGDTVFFKTVAHLRALGAVTVVQTDPTKDVFYFHRARRVRVEGFSFRGGRHQLNMSTLNREACNFLVRGCAFRDSSDAAIKSIGRMVAEGYDDIQVDHGFDIGEFMPDKNGKFRFEPRYAKGRWNNNSTFILYEDCVFEGCAHAVWSHSDGTVMRNCRVRQPAVAGSTFRLQQNFHFYDVSVTVERDPNLRQSVFSFSGGVTAAIEDSSFRTSNGSGVCLVESTSWTSGVPPSLILRRCQVESGGCPEGSIVHFAKNKYLALVAMDDVVETSGRPVKAIGFGEGEPTEESLRESSGIFRECGNCCCFAFALGKMSPNVVKDGNAVFQKYRMPYPEDIPTPPLTRRPVPVRSGKVMMATAFGVDADPKTDDTMAMERFVAALANEPGAVGVLPGVWILLSRPVELNGDFELMGAGTAAFRHVDSASGFFKVANGAKVLLKNLLFENGRHVIEYCAHRAQPTDICLDNCYSYNTEGYDRFNGACFDIVARENPENVSFMVTKGCYYHALFYRGNAKAHMDAFWFRGWPNVNRDQPMTEGCYIKNGRGGILRVTDVLGVPCTFRRFPKKEANNPKMVAGDYRWIDNYGELFSDFVRYGGEYGGVVPVYGYAGSTSYVEGGFAEYKAFSCRRTPALCTRPDVDVRFFALVCLNQDVEHPPVATWCARFGEGQKPLAKQDFRVVFPFRSPEVE